MKKGFLISISKKERVKYSCAFFSGRTTLEIYEKENKNIVYKIEKNSFYIKIGSCDDLFKNNNNGLIITYSEGVLSISSDFLGSEILYIKYKKDEILISNKIKNLKEKENIDLASIYAFLSSGFTPGSKTFLEGIYKTRQLEYLQINDKDLNVKCKKNKIWRKETDLTNFSEISENLIGILMNSSESNLMFSAGWDSRLLLTKNVNRINTFYTHGDLQSREIDISQKIARNTQRSIYLASLQDTNYSADLLNEMLVKFEHCLFPHWYHASQTLLNLNTLPISSGLGVEHISGHYGINSLYNGRKKAESLRKLLFNPSYYENLSNGKSIEILVPLLSSAFDSLPWFFKREFNLSEINRDHIDNTREILNEYSDEGTFGINELSERFKMEHINRQFFVFQTKCSIYNQGYSHPYIDSELAKMVVKIPYFKRVNYKLSRHIVTNYNPALLEQPLAATLVSAKRSIPIQEASRIIRILLEKSYKFKTKKIKKGLGWNNFQFLNNTSHFHDYIEILKSPIWDKVNMHCFVKDYTDKNLDAYSLLEMLTKIITVDYHITD